MHSTPEPSTILITGAARRIGRVVALRFAADGWRVGVHYRHSRVEAEQVVGEITAAGGRAAVLQADLADLPQMTALVADCSRALGAPTCLINNASEFAPDEAGTVSEASWARHLDVNLKAPIFLAQAFAAHLPDGKTGNIINIIDQRVWRLSPEFFSYTISKAALWTATRTLAQALAPRIRVNAIGPGPVLRNIHQTEASFEREWGTTPLERGTTPEEIATTIRYILDAPALTGQMIALDGGQHLDWRHPGSTPAKGA